MITFYTPVLFSEVISSFAFALILVKYNIRALFTF